MLYGREPVFPLETAFVPSDIAKEAQGDYVTTLQERLRQIREAGIYNLQRHQQKVEGKRPPLSTLVDYQPNTKVWLFDPVVPLYKSKKTTTGIERPLRGREADGPQVVYRQAPKLSQTNSR